MLNQHNRGRLAITAGILVAAIAAIHGLDAAERVALRRQLKEFPQTVGDWGSRDLPLSSRIIAAAGVDDYLNRIYADQRGHWLELYIGYYQSQRTGDTIHSPKNCLPGSGWEPLQAGQLTIPTGETLPITVNEYVVEKGKEKDLVLYWYQSRGRSEASEYQAKVSLVLDAVLRHRTDGALVRIWTPLDDSLETSRARAASFVAAIFPHLGEFLPR